MSCCSNSNWVAAIHLSSCWWLLFSSAPRVHKSIELLWHKTPDFTPDMRPPNRPDLSRSHSGMHQKQQGTSYITDKLWLLMAYYISQAMVKTPSRRGRQFCCSFVVNLLQYKFAKNYQNTMRFHKVIAKIERCNFFASQCICITHGVITKI